MIEPFQSATINELSAALSKAQAEFPAIPKSRIVDFIPKDGRRVKYNYADLSDVIEAIKGPLAKNGLSHSEQLVMIENRVVLFTRLLHSSGQWILSTYPVTLGSKPQESGSAITYARRYTLSSLLGIQAEEDNDGESAPPLQQSKSAVGKPPVVIKPKPAEPPKQERRQPVPTDVDYDAKRAGFKTIKALQKDLNISDENLNTFLENHFKIDKLELLTLKEMNTTVLELEKMRPVLEKPIDVDPSFASESSYLDDPRDVK